MIRMDLSVRGMTGTITSGGAVWAGIGRGGRQSKTCYRWRHLRFAITKTIRDTGVGSLALRVSSDASVGVSVDSLTDDLKTVKELCLQTCKELIPRST